MFGCRLIIHVIEIIGVMRVRVEIQNILCDLSEQRTTGRKRTLMGDRQGLAEDEREESKGC